MGLPSRFLEKKFVKDEKGDDITRFDDTDPDPSIYTTSKKLR
jgi:hypothetical protein